MTPLPNIAFDAEDGADIAALEGTLVVLAGADGTMTFAAAAADAAMGGGIARALAEESFKGKPGVVGSFAFPSGLAVSRVVLACLGAEPDAAAARRTGGAVAKALAAKGAVTLAVSGTADAAAADLVLAVALRLYDFREYKKVEEDAPSPGPRSIRVLAANPETLARESRAHMALAEGIYFSRDLVNEPANRLTTG
ncbi:MAG: M17 family peptidase N-terminal domain-containing protein, partial [Pseudomonadota bacterium]